MKTNDNKILSHSVWNCKYHIVFAPKYRRKIFYESHRKEIIASHSNLVISCLIICNGINYSFLLS